MHRTSLSWWEPAWREFKRDLPHQQPPYSKRNWGSELHSLCSYQGKMKPALAYHLIRVFVPRAGRMLDVFTGVGTIPFEAAQAGATTFGFDISPAALPIARAKVGLPRREAVHQVLQALARDLDEREPSPAEYEEADVFGFNGKLSEFFDRRTLREVLLARDFFISNPPSDPSVSLVMASVLHVLHGNRPYALSRRSHPITPFAPSGDFEYKSLIKAATAKVEKSLAAERASGFVPGITFNQDATKTWPEAVRDLDAIITSPPFYDSTRFHMGNWMRLWFAGWSPSDFKNRPKAFIDERQKLSLDVYDPIFNLAHERLRPDGVFVLHLGRSRKCDMANSLAEHASQFMDVADVFSESVDHCESHGIRDQGTVVDHQYLVLVNRGRAR